MPLFNSFTESAARGLGVGSGGIMPPNPPTIIAPASGNPIINTKFSAEVLFTPSSPTTFVIPSHRYRLIKTSDSSVTVDWTTVPSNPFTISSLLASTNYTLYMTALDASAVESSSTTARTFTTKDDILIQAPTPGLTSPSITYPTPIYIGITWTTGIPTGGDVGGNSITLRQYAVTTSSAVPGSYSTFSGSSGTLDVTQTTSAVTLTTGQTYYVHFKYTDSTSATSLTQNSITTATENAPGIPGVSTFVQTGPTTATLTRGASTAGTYNTAYQYRYWVSDATSSVAATGAWESMNSNPIFITGLTSDSYYDAQVRAVNISPGSSVSSERNYDVILTASAGAPTAVAPTLASDSVSYPILPYMSITWAAGTAGTYPITTRQYSVVAGTGAAGAFTTVTGATGTVSVTSTAAGAAIVAGTSYTVYMKYIALSPGGQTASATASAVRTTGTEILANAPTVSVALPAIVDDGRTQIIITRGDYTNSPTYQQKYQYAYGLSSDPTNFADFPSTGTASSVTVTGLFSDTTYYVRIKAISLGTGASGAISINASVVTNSASSPIAAAPTLASDSVSYSTPPYMSITWAAGTAGTNPITTRQYSVVAGTGAAGAFTTVPGNTATGTVSVTSTAAGAAIVAGTQYTVYMRYTADSPGGQSLSKSNDASATRVTGAEILANAPTVSTLTSGTTQINITRGAYSNTPTYLQKYQYAIGTSTSPTNFADFSDDGTPTTETVNGLFSDTTYYVLTRGVSLTTGAAGATSTSASIATTAAGGPTGVAPTLTSTQVTYSTPPFISITWAAGTAGTNPITTRAYSVVAGAGAAGTFTPVTGTTGTVSVTTTAAGAAITPGTSYKVYMRYTASSPGGTSPSLSDDKSATHTTAAEIDPTPAAPTLTSTQVTYPTLPFIKIAWTAGTAGTYAITTRAYSVVAGTGAAGAFTTVTGTSGNVSPTTTAAGAAITPGTSYTVYMRYTASSGTSTDASAVHTTAAEIAPTVTATLITTGLTTATVSRTSSNGTYAISGYEYRVYAGTTASGSFVAMSGDTESITDLDTTLNAGYRCQVRATAGTSGTTTTDTSDTAEVLANAPTTTLTLVAGTSSTARGQLTITHSNHTNYPTYLQNYQYAIGTSPSPDNWEYFGNFGFESSITLDRTPDETYHVRTRAISTEGEKYAGTASANVQQRLNPLLPPTPTLVWRNTMTASSYGTALFTIGNNGGSTTVVKIFRRTVSGSNTGADEFTKATGDQQITGHASNGGTSYYVAYNYNRLGEQSTASTQRRWIRPQKDVAKTWTASSFGLNTNYTAYTYAIPTNTCEPFRVAVRFPSSGIAATEDEPGYMRVDYVTATLSCGVQLKRPSEYGSNVNFQEPDEVVDSGPYAGTYPVTTPLPSLCNTDNLRFSTATYVNSTTITSVSNAQPTTLSGTTPNLGGSDQSWYRIFATPVGGTSLHNKVFFVSSSSGKSWGSGCTLSLKGDYFSAKNMQAVGVETIDGTIT